jgi:hypothetical protein
VLHLLPLRDAMMPVPVMLSGVVVLGLTLVVVHRLCRRLLPASATTRWVAVTLTASCFPFVYWTLGGLEVGLAAFLVAWAALLALELRETWSRARAWRLALALGAAVLTRDDLLVPAVVILVFLAWQVPAQWRRRVVTAAGRDGGWWNGGLRGRRAPRLPARLLRRSAAQHLLPQARRHPAD